MSLDYPDYEEIKRRRKHLLAFAWMVGDRLHYLGVFGALGILLFVFVYVPLKCLFLFLQHKPLPVFVNLQANGCRVACLYGLSSAYFYIRLD